MPEFRRVDSLDTISDNTDPLDYDVEEEELEAQREWEESLEQLQQGHQAKLRGSFRPYTPRSSWRIF